jgi:RNA polymerase sigma-70 factor, ECF subfamily
MELAVGLLDTPTARQAAALSSGEAMSVESAYSAYREQLLGYLVSLTHDRETAEDTLHEAFARLAREVGAGRTPQNVRAWLYQVSRNVVVSRGRRQQVAEKWLGRQFDDRVGASAEEHYLLREASTELRQAMLELEPKDRTALLMAAEGYTGDEIAAAIGRTSAAVRTRICRARGRLRNQLQGTLSAGPAVTAG